MPRKPNKSEIRQKVTSMKPLYSSNNTNAHANTHRSRRKQQPRKSIIEDETMEKVSSLEESGGSINTPISGSCETMVEDQTVILQDSNDEEASIGSSGCFQGLQPVQGAELSDNAFTEKQLTKSRNEEESSDGLVCEIAADDIHNFLNEIRTPRSTENEKFKEVYASIPKMRSSSPPRFTTKGVKKKRLKPEQLGVRVIGKAEGNPFSSYRKRRSGIIYGNQPLKNVEEMEKYTGAAINIKKVLRKQSQNVRVSSYVQPKILAEARKLHGQKSPDRSKVKEEEADADADADIDIETVEVNVFNLKPEDTVAPVQETKRRRGRKPGRTVLECEDCGYKTTHSGHMKIHILCVHKDVKLLQCQYEGCNYECARKGSMTRHEKCVHRKDKVFKCELCNFESAWSISLERHIVTKHEKLKPWTCELCKKSFGQQFTLTTHMNTVHKKVKRIKCAFCTFRSSTRMSVRSHILRTHSEEIEKAMNSAQDDEIETELDVDPRNEKLVYGVDYDESISEVTVSQADGDISEIDAKIEQ